MSDLVVIPLDDLEAMLGRLLDEKFAVAGQRDDWLDAKQAATVLGISPAHVRNLVCDGKLPRHGPKGSRLRFRRGEIDAHIKGH